MTKLKNLLPKKLSDCIDVGLADLDAAKKAGMKVDMLHWYAKTGKSNKTCTVCLAGAVMAREFDLEQDEEISPYALLSGRLITGHDERRLNALNDLRKGLVASALRDIGEGVEAAKTPWFEFFNDGAEDTKAWRKKMLEVRDHLRSRGL